MELSLIVVLMFEAVSLETVHPGSHRSLWGIARP